MIKNYIYLIFTALIINCYTYAAEYVVGFDYSTYNPAVYGYSVYPVQAPVYYFDRKTNTIHKGTMTMHTVSSCLLTYCYIQRALTHLYSEDGKLFQSHDIQY